MNINFLKKTEENSKLILFFPGWSCGKELYEDFEFQGWDVAMVENYEDLTFSLSPLSNYSTIYLVAWSLGVFMASILDFGGKITAAFAINGTTCPVDDIYGIPETIYDKTAENLTPASLLKFRRRMAGSSQVFKSLFFKNFSEEETSLLKSQLLLIRDWQKNLPDYPLPWKKAYLSKNDAIFPYENMVNCWARERFTENLEIVSLDESHYVPFSKIIRYCIPVLEKVSRRFSNAGKTYDDRAVAQRRLASLLADHIQKSGIKKNGTVLEIGPGTGLFTKEIIDKFSPSRIDFIDISDVRPDSKGIPSSFYQADAEECISRMDKKYDAVLSSATLQWFVNLPLFFKNVANRLSENGLFGFSTFLPGNLEELNPLRPSPIHYHSVDEINEWLNPYFEDIRVECEDIVLQFDSAKEVFSHLRETGVGGSAPASQLPLSVIRELRTLTFKCACFSAKRKNK